MRQAFVIITMKLTTYYATTQLHIQKIQGHMWIEGLQQVHEHRMWT